jgi:hypothetical protein
VSSTAFENSEFTSEYSKERAATAFELSPGKMHHESLGEKYYLGYFLLLLSVQRGQKNAFPAISPKNMPTIKRDAAPEQASA